MPPSFSDLEYWESRFLSTQDPFDWLLPATALDDLILKTIQSSPDPESGKILHIGCGSSELSYRLGELIQDRKRVVNSDYSKTAVDLGRKMEQERSSHGPRGSGEPSVKNAVSSSTIGTIKQEDARRDGGWMNWKVLDLLDPLSIGTMRANKFDIIIDKSTSDAISCGSDIPIPTPYSLSLSPEPQSTPSIHPIHPLHLLALNLAHLTNPNGRWLCISYSSDRFPFLPPHPAQGEEEHFDPEIFGTLHPSELWTLERKWEVHTPSASDEEEEGRKVFRPKDGFWVYELVRTEAPF